MNNTMSLQEFLLSELERLECFGEWYTAMAELNPEHFPLEFPEYNTGAWDEAFAEYSIDDDVYKLDID